MIKLTGIDGTPVFIDSEGIDFVRTTPNGTLVVAVDGRTVVKESYLWVFREIQKREPNIEFVDDGWNIQISR